jgi:hypothetical protein
VSLEFPPDICPECAACWDDVGPVQHREKQPDGTWRDVYGRWTEWRKPLPSTPETPRISVRDQYAVVGDLRMWVHLVSQDGEGIGFFIHDGVRSFAAWMFVEGEGPNRLLGRYSAGRYALRAIVEDATGYRMPTRNRAGIRQAWYESYV